MANQLPLSSKSDAVELQSAPRGEKQPTAKVQDRDLATDIFCISRMETKEKSKATRQGLVLE